MDRNWVALQRRFANALQVDVELILSTFATAIRGSIFTCSLAPLYETIETHRRTSRS